MARQYGILTNTSGGVTSIVVNDLTDNETIEKAEARNSEGKVTDIKAYSQSKTVTIRGLLDAATITVHAGDKITLGGKDYLVDTVDKHEQNTNFAEVTVTAATADNATIHPLSSGGAVSGN